MTVASATLAGHRATRARVSLPASGCWYADACVDGDVELAGSVELVIADLTLRGTVLAGGPNVPKTGRSWFQVVGGAGGWGRTIGPKPYATDSGVKLTTVVTDAAKDCGETIDAATMPLTERVGPAFVRGEAPASRVLEQVRPSDWYVGEDGVTRLGKRARRDFAGVATRVMSDRAAGTIKLAPSSIATLLPGITVDGVEAVDVEHELSAGEGLRTTIWGAGVSGRSSRRLEVWRRIIEHFDPHRKYRGLFEYRIVTPAGKRLNLQAVRKSVGLPDLERVPVRGGIAGVDVTYIPGTRVLVGFIDCTPTRPFVFAFEDPEGEGFLPLITHINAQTAVRLGPVGVRPVICAGDLAGGLFPCVPLSPVTQAKVLGG